MAAFSGRCQPVGQKQSFIGACGFHFPAHEYFEFAMKRKIAAILIADIAGYSALVADNDEQTVRRLMSYRSLFDEVTGQFSGRVIDATGDSVLAEFASPVDAVRCAVEVQESLRVRNLAYPPGQHMLCRIGVAMGDVIEDAGTVTGDAVNVAARLESLAPAGSICVSRAVYDEVRNKLTARFTDIGKRMVKNIPFPIHAYTLVLSPVAENDRHKLWKPAVAALLRWAFVFAVAGAVVLTSAFLVTRIDRRAEPAHAVLEVNPVPVRDGPPPQPESPQTATDVSEGNAPNPPPRKDRPCAELRAICEAAGFQLGAAPQGNGLWVHCMVPLLRARPQRPRSARPLPQADAKAVEACREAMKNAGESPEGGPFPPPFVRDR